MNDVNIRVTGIQTDSMGDRDKIEIETEAKYYTKGASEYLVYDESELTGMEGSKTRLKISLGNVTMTRLGAVRTKMEFVKDEERDICYECPQGTFYMKIWTDDINIEYIEDQLSCIKVFYEMDFQNDYKTKHSLCIELVG